VQRLGAEIAACDLQGFILTNRSAGPDTDPRYPRRRAAGGGLCPAYEDVIPRQGGEAITRHYQKHSRRTWHRRGERTGPLRRSCGEAARFNRGDGRTAHASNTIGPETCTGR